MDKLGRSLPEAVQRDTDVLATEEEQEEARSQAAEARQKERNEKKLSTPNSAIKKNSKLTSSASSSTSNGGVVANVLDRHLGDSNAIQAVSVLLQNSTQEEAVSLKQELKQIIESSRRKRSIEEISSSIF